MKVHRILPTLGFALFVLVLGARSARAQSVACEVLEVSATTGSPEIPASLNRLAKKLKRPPFTSWNRFALLSTRAQTMQLQVPEAIGLSRGGAELLVRGIERGDNRRARISLAVTMTDAKRRRVVDTRATIDAGDFFAVGYSLPNNDGHLIAISCK